MNSVQTLSEITGKFTGTFHGKINLKKEFEMLENGGLRLFLPKMQALYHSGWHPGNIYSCWNCTKEVIQTAKIDIKIITHN